MLSKDLELLMYFTDAVDSCKFTESPPDAIFNGMTVAFKYGVEHPFVLDVQPIPFTLPEICRLLLASPKLDTIVVFAFCVVEKPMLRTTKAKAAATITITIVITAASKPETPR